MDLYGYDSVDQVIAAEITGEQMGGAVGVWAVGGPSGPVFAVNEMAKSFSEWGAATQPGSPVAEVVNSVQRSDEAATVEGCVG